MTPSQAAKTFGFKSLAQVAKIAHIHADTLRLYHQTKPQLFRVICLGCAFLRDNIEIG